MNGLDELIRFLRARYDEAEALATAAGEGDEHGGLAWHQDDPRRAPGKIVDKHGCTIVYDEGSPTADEAAFIAANDPAHRLAGIAGKRRIVDMAEAQHGYHLPEGVHDGRSDDERKRDEGMQVMLAEVLHCLAEEFAAHPEYNVKEWGEFV